MAGNTPEGLGDDFLEQILAVQPAYEVGSMPMLQLSSGDGGGDGGGGLRGLGMGVIPLGLNLEQQGFLSREDSNHNNNNINSASSAMNERDSVHMTGLFPTFGQFQAPPLRPAPPPSAPPQLHQPFHSQPVSGSVAGVPHPPVIRPRVRARRGQATDPHSIAERLRRERIAERMKALQELVPSANKTDRAAMLDEIVNYVKFLRLQVKGEGIEDGTYEQAWEKWSTDGTEQEVAKLMEEDIGAAMQFLQSKALCIMPISLASVVFWTHQLEAPTLIKPESDTPS